MKKILHTPLFIRLFHWEYWPFHAVYALVYPYWLWLCLKARSLFFFSTSNPAIKNGGFLMESKKEIYDLMPSYLYPKTVLVKAGTPAEHIHILLDSGLNFPLIAKPDIGLRGLAVTKLNNIQELITYVRTSKVDFLIQQFIPYELEAGIFYYRFPDESNGHISGIVLKEFLTVTGDGLSSIMTLLKQNKRYILQLNTLKSIYKDQLNHVLKEGEKRILAHYGNHSRGAKFIDVSWRIDQPLTQVIDRACKEIPGFYYGRLDVRFNSWEELKTGAHFSIIEINGAGSEPTHIYDPRHSIIFAWKEIMRHWNILYKISRQNRKNQAYMDFRSGVNMFRQNSVHLKLLKNTEP
jgi:hypothetical protein